MIHDLSLHYYNSLMYRRPFPPLTLANKIHVQLAHAQPGRATAEDTRKRTGDDQPAPEKTYRYHLSHTALKTHAVRERANRAALFLQQVVLPSSSNTNKLTPSCLKTTTTEIGGRFGSLGMWRIKISSRTTKHSGTVLLRTWASTLRTGKEDRLPIYLNARSR